MEPAPAHTPHTNPLPPMPEFSPPGQQPDAYGHQQFLPAFSLFTPSIEALKCNLGTMLALILTPLVLSIPVGISLFASAHSTSDAYSGVSTGFNVAAMLIGMVVIFFLSLVLSPALIAAQLAGARGEKLGLKAALKLGLRYALPYLGLSIIIGIITIVGFILLIVPGVFAMQRLLLAPFFLIDGKAGVIGSIKESARVSKLYGGPVWGLLGVELLISVICGVPFLGWVAGVVMLVLYYCAPAVRYYEIKKVEINTKTA